MEECNVREIYFDNGATTWQKPRSVALEMERAMRECANPGRGSHKPARNAAERVFDARAAISEMFGCDVERVVFTLNATAALNYAIKGLATEGCHILIDNLCHNAVRRPVIALSEKRGCTFDFYDATLCDEMILSDIERRIRPSTALIVATHQCNISSNVLPIEKIGALCKRKGIHFVVDASQSAGHLPIDVQRMNISALCMPGHKGLYGPMGVGVLIAGDGAVFDTLIEGGAGIASLDRGMPDDLPDRLEAGTLPVPAIAGLLSGVRFVDKVGVHEIHRHECALAKVLTGGLSEIRGAHIYGEAHGSNVSFTLEGHTPDEIGEYLSDRGIYVRCGYHCAPVAHRTLGSYDRGSVRVSFSYMNKISEVERFLDVLRGI